MSSRVFIVQRPAYYDRKKRGWINKYDLSPAKEHGELVFLLRPGNLFRDRIDDAVARLERELAGFTPEDHVMAVGDPVAIAAAVMVASRRTGGVVSVLKYDRLGNRYEAYPVRLPQNDG